MTHPQDEIALDPSAGTAADGRRPHETNADAYHRLKKQYIKETQPVTDTAMLDWLETKEANVYADESIGDGWWLESRSGTRKAKYPTLRAAITAAMTGADPCL